jgi:hypothetical protein
MAGAAKRATSNSSSALTAANYNAPATPIADAADQLGLSLVGAMLCCSRARILFQLNHRNYVDTAGLQRVIVARSVLGLKTKRRRSFQENPKNGGARGR